MEMVSVRSPVAVVVSVRSPLAAVVSARSPVAELLARSIPIRRPVGWDTVYAEPVSRSGCSISLVSMSVVYRLL